MESLLSLKVSSIVKLVNIDYWVLSDIFIADASLKLACIDAIPFLFLSMLPAD